MIEKSLNLHLTLNMDLNDSNYSWHDPHVQQNYSISIPVELFSKEQFGKMIQKAVDAMVNEYPLVKAEYEAKQNAEQEEETE